MTQSTLPPQSRTSNRGEGVKMVQLTFLVVLSRLFSLPESEGDLVGFK
jgi:hypothetical protein